MPVQAPADNSLSKIDLKDWANVFLYDDRIFNSILSELLDVYSQPDTMKIYTHGYPPGL